VASAADSGGEPGSPQDGSQSQSSARQSVADRRQCPPESAGGFPVTQAFQIAEDDGRAKPLRQPADRVVDQGGNFGVAVCPVAYASGSDGGGLLFLLPAPRRGGAGVGRDAARHFIKPGPQIAAHPQRPGLACQHQKGRLKRIFGVVRVAQRRPARAIDERAMSMQQHGKRRLRPGARRLEDVPK